MTDENKDYRSKPWQTLKALLAEHGEEWKGMEHAVAFLEAKDAEASKSLGAGDMQEGGSENTTDQENPELPEENTGDDDLVTGDDLLDAPADPEITTDPAPEKPKKSKAPKFNVNEKHGVISGETNARYWQNGHHFDGQGNYIKPEDVK